MLFRFNQFVCLWVLMTSLSAEPLHVIIQSPLEPSESPGDVELDATPVIHRVIDAENFHINTQDLQTIIRDTTGLQIQQSGGLGSFSSVSLRGASSEQVMVFVDGVALNDSVNGYVDLSLIPVSDVERIEIYRGATPIELGDASIGGAINIITRRVKGPAANQVKASLGSYGAQNVSGKFGWQSGDHVWRIVADKTHNDNDFPLLNDYLYPNSPENAFEDTRHNAMIDQESALLSWKTYQQRVRYQASLKYFNKHQQLPGLDNSPLVETSLATDIVQINTRVEFLSDHKNKSSHSVDAYVLNKNERLDDRFASVTITPQYHDDLTRRGGVKYFIKIPYDVATLRLSADISHQQYSYHDLLGEIDDTEHRRDKAVLNAGLRHISSDGSTSYDMNVAWTKVDDHLDATLDNSGDPVEAQQRQFEYSDLRLGLSKRFQSGLRLKSNLGQYERVPYFYELYGDRGFFQGQHDLLPESSLNFDIGIDYIYIKPESWMHNARLGLNYFRNQSDDLIVRVYNAQGIGVAQNIADATIQGIETEFSFQPTKQFTVLYNLTYQDTENHSDKTWLDGNQIPGQFALSSLLSLSYQQSNWFYHLEHVAKERMYYDSANLLAASDRNIWRIQVKKKFKQLTTELSIENIFDKRYEDFNGYPMPGRLLLFGLAYQF